MYTCWQRNKEQKDEETFADDEYWQMIFKCAWLSVNSIGRWKRLAEWVFVSQSIKDFLYTLLSVFASFFFVVERERESFPKKIAGKKSVIKVYRMNSWLNKMAAKCRLLCHQSDAERTKNNLATLFLPQESVVCYLKSIGAAWAKQLSYSRKTSVPFAGLFFLPIGDFFRHPWCIVPWISTRQHHPVRTVREGGSRISLCLARSTWIHIHWCTQKQRPWPNIFKLFLYFFRSFVVEFIDFSFLIFISLFSIDIRLPFPLSHQHDQK